MRSYRTGFLAVIVLCASAAWADTVDLPLTDDAYIVANNPDVNTGTWARIVVHSYGPRYGLVRFDAASIAGQQVSEATLTLYLNSLASNGTISVYAITSGWSEATVTWNNQPPAETMATAIVELTTGDVGSLVAIDVTSAVQRWADGSLTDAGFLIVTSEDIRAKFDAKEMVGGIPATLVVDTGDLPVFDGGAIVLDLSNPDNCNIDEPGYYVLDRSWNFSDFSETGPACGYGIHISASGGVTFDLSGFTIESGSSWGNYYAVLWIDTESGVVLRNGVLRGIRVAVEASVGSDMWGRVTLDRIRAGGGVLLDNRPVTVTGGRFSGSLERSLVAGADSRVIGADFACNEEACLEVGESSLVKDCTFDAAIALSTYPGGTIVAGNVIEGWMWIGGNGNVVAGNVGGSITVTGTGNVIEGNIGSGIAFEDVGNFFGNNRVKLPGGFSGTEGNVDWGGNVTY